MNWWAKSIHMEAPRQRPLTAEQKAKVEDSLNKTNMPAEVRAKVDAALNQPSPTPATSPDQSPTPATDQQQDEPRLFEFDPADGKSTPFEKWLETRAKEKMGEHGTKAALFMKTLVSNLPYMMLCCIPFFALILKLLYIRHRIFYIDHLVYALHVHSFAYACLMIIALVTVGLARIHLGALGGWLIGLLWTLFAVQIFLSIRRVYNQGWFKTVIKFWLGGAVYLIILLLGLAATFFATLAT